MIPETIGGFLTAVIGSGITVTLIYLGWRMLFNGNKDDECL